MANKKNSASITIQKRLTEDDLNNYKKLSISNLNNIPTFGYMTIKKIKDLGLNDVQRALDSDNFVKICNKNGGFDLSLINPIKVHINTETGEATCPDGAHTGSNFVALAEMGKLPWTMEVPVIIYNGTQSQASKLFALHNKIGISPVSAESVTIAQVGYNDEQAIRVCKMLKRYSRTFKPMKNYLGNDSLLTGLMTGREVKRARFEKAIDNYNSEALDSTFELLDHAYPNSKSESMMLLIALCQLFTWYPILTNQPQPWQLFKTWFKSVSDTDGQGDQAHWIKTRSGDSGSERFIAMNIVLQFIKDQEVVQMEHNDSKGHPDLLDQVYFNIISSRYDELMLSDIQFKGKEMLETTLSVK